MRHSKILLLIAVVWCGANSGFAQTWTLTSAPNMAWRSVASSANGTKLIAVVGGTSAGPIYTSTNSGATWVSNSAPLRNWSCVASSADGNTLAAAVGGYDGTAGSIYISTNAGMTWTASTSPARVWASIAVSADGTKLVAAVKYSSPASIYRSWDSGATWTSNNLAGALYPYGVASSADGSRLAVAAALGAVYTSADAGVAWTSNNIGSLVSDQACITSSTDGSKLSVGPRGNGGPIWTSTNSGTTWITNSVRQVWGGIASSADGTKLIAVSYPAIYTSVNLGVIWTSNNAPRLEWTSVASSADGNILIAAAQNGGIWTLQTAPAPSMIIAPTNGSLKLSWLVPSTNFVMQQSPDLQNWADMTNQPVLNLTNLQNEVILSPPGSNVFYRLKTS